MSICPLADSLDGCLMIDVMLITYNESLNLPNCLRALQGWTNAIYVVDSGSTDGTQQIARSFGAHVVHHEWQGYAQQKNWGLLNLPLTAPWTLILDADEVITPSLRERLVQIASQPPDTVLQNGYFVNRVTYFLGRPIRHCGYFPSWNLRLFKRGKARYEDRVVHEHMIIDDPVGYIRDPMVHDDRRGLEHYVAKHNRYSTLEAKALYGEKHGQLATPAAKLPRETTARRWLKRNVLPHVPMPWLWRFLYMYVMRLGILDGQAGLEFCKFISMYDYLVVLKLRALERQQRLGRTDVPTAASAASVDDQLLPPDGFGVQDGLNGLSLPDAGAFEQDRLPGWTDEEISDRASPTGVALQPAADSGAEAVGAAAGVQVAPDASQAALPRRAAKLQPTGMIAVPDKPRAACKSVSILILTRNEEANLPACLESVGWCDDVVVLDSYSTDRTAELALARGARVVKREFDNWSAHQNWAMEHIQFAHEWVFYLDADERMTDALKHELLAIAQSPREQRVAFYCGRKNYFMGKWIKRSMPPGLIMRFFRPQHIRFERLVNPTPVISGEHGYLRSYFIHYNFSKGLSEWFEKHNNYSRMEALEGMKLLRGEPAGGGAGQRPSLFSRDRALRRRALKNLSFRLPLRPAVKFLYMYFVRRGILDGLPGLTYCTLQAMYEYMIVVKMRELRRREKGLPI